MDKRRQARLIQVLYDEVREIKDADIYQFTMDILKVVPQVFWEKRASRSHHTPDERGDFGTLIHTIRVMKTSAVLCEIPDITGLYRDMIRSASALHDTCKYGLDGKAESSVDGHAELLRVLVERNNIHCKCDELILQMVEAHMGRWGASIYTPKLGFNAIVHIADVVCDKVLEVLNKDEW